MLVGKEKTNGTLEPAGDKRLEDRAAPLVERIRAVTRTGQENAGWICVVDLERVVAIGSGQGLDNNP